MVPEVPAQSTPILGAAISECRSAEAKSSEGQPFSICLEEALDARDGSNQDPISDALSALTHVPVMTAMAFCTGVHTVEQACPSQTVVESPAISAGPSGACIAADLTAVSRQGEIVNRNTVSEVDLPNPRVSVPSASAGSNLLVSNVPDVRTQVVFSQASENIPQDILADGVKVAQLPGDTISKGLPFDPEGDALSGDPGVSVASRQQPVTGDQSITRSHTAPGPTDLQVLEEVKGGVSNVDDQVPDGGHVFVRELVIKDGYVAGHQSNLSWQQQPALGDPERVADLAGHKSAVQGISHIESSTSPHLDAPTVVSDSENLVFTSDRGKESVDGKSASRDVVSDHNIRFTFSALGVDRSGMANHRLFETPALVNVPSGADFPVRLINQVVRAIASRRSEDRTEILIRLHPPELGSVAVRVVQDTQGLSSHISTATEEVCNLLQSHLPLLKNALLEAGLSLSSVTVSHDSSLNNTLGSPAHQGWNQQGGSLSQNRRAFYASRGSSEGMVGGSDWMVVSVQASSPVDSARYTWLA